MKHGWMIALLSIGLQTAWSAPSQDEPVKATFSLTPAGTIVAYTKNVAAKIVRTKDGNFTASSIEVPLNMLSTDNSLRDQHMKNKYLEVAKFPKALLSGVNAKSGKFTGKLTLHGKTTAVAGQYKVKGDKINATFPIKLGDYGITIPTYLGVGVEDEGTIEVNLPYKK